MSGTGTIDLERRIIGTLGAGVLLVVCLVWLDAETALLLLFLLGAFYPVAIVYIALIAFLLLRAVKQQHSALAVFVFVSALYILAWSVTLYRGIASYSEFQTSLIVVLSAVYSLYCIGAAIALRHKGE